MNFLPEYVECNGRKMCVGGVAAINCHESDSHREQDPSFQVSATPPEVTERAQKSSASETRLKEIASMLGYTLKPLYE